MMETAYQVGDKITMKKPHACGGNAWTVARVGVDVKLQCDGCKKYVNLTRDEMKKRVKRVEQERNDNVE